MVANESGFTYLRCLTRDYVWFPLPRYRSSEVLRTRAVGRERRSSAFTGKVTGENANGIFRSLLQPFLVFAHHSFPSLLRFSTRFNVNCVSPVLRLVSSDSFVFVPGSRHFGIDGFCVFYAYIALLSSVQSVPIRSLAVVRR